MDSAKNSTLHQSSSSISSMLRTWYHALLLAPIDPMYTMALNVQMNAVAYAYALDMIDLAPTCGKGYLRLASVYMQIGQHHYAVEAYHQGLLAVPRSDPYYGTLQDRYENEQGQLCDNDDTTTGQQRRLSRKKYNSIPVPRHIFISIFENLDFADRRRCMAVCKHWRIYLQDWPNMWESVDIRNPPRYHADRPASQRLWNSYQLYMRSKPIKSVVLYNADSITWIRYSTTIKSIICHGGSISPDLDLSSAGTQLKTLELHRVQGVTFADVLNSGIMKRGYLERLVYHPYSNDNGNDDDNVVQEIPCSLKQHQDGVAVSSLKQLNVTLSSSMSDYTERRLRILFPCLETLIFTIPLLGTLTCTYPKPAPKKETLAAKVFPFSSATSNSSDTVVSTIASVQISKDAWQHDTERAMQSLSFLKSWQYLRLYNSKDKETRNHKFIPRVLKHCQNVHTLVLTDWNITSDIVTLGLQELRELTFQQCHFSTTEPDLMALVQALPQLLRIDFQECFGVTQTSQQQVKEMIISRNK